MTPPMEHAAAPTQAAAPSRAATGDGARRSNIEVIIPCFNEAENIPHALKSVVGWADAVHVVDSESKDATRDIAAKFGANVVIRPWLGYAKQKNWALDNLPIKSDWVYILDADEAITPELRDEMLAITQQPAGETPEAGFYINRVTYFLNKPLWHCGYFPAYNLRLFKRGTARYEEREVHEHMVVGGSTRRLKHLMLHNDRRGLENYIAKHNRYSTLEARELIRERREGRAKDETELERGIAFRRWLKRNVLPRLPASFLWRFAYMYIIRRGFLDGMTGLRFCLFLASYDLFIRLKMVELEAYARDGSVGVSSSKAGLAVAEGTVTTTEGAV